MRIDEAKGRLDESRRHAGSHQAATLTSSQMDVATYREYSYLRRKALQDMSAYSPFVRSPTETTRGANDAQ